PAPPPRAPRGPGARESRRAAWCGVARAASASALPRGRAPGLERRVELAVEMDDRALEAAELEELVRAAREPALDPEGDRVVLGGTGVDELAPAARRLASARVVGPVRQAVRDEARAIDGERLEHDH